MQRLAFIIVAISVLVGIAMPSEPPSAVEVNQSIMIDEGGTASQAFASDSGDEASISPSYGGVTVLDRAPNGHFYTRASVNGQALSFVVDTGASSVALTIDDARRIGIHVDPSSFRTVGEGASGPTRGMFITLDKVEVAGRTVEQVNAVVLEGLPVNLLGQSVLTRLGAVEMKADRMILR